MQTDTLIDLMNGATAMGSLAIGAIFLRYWRSSFDTLFAAFALAFAMLSASRIAASLQSADDYALAAYGLRCLAFLIIITAIVNKNRAPG